MAEFVMKDMVRKRCLEDKIYVASSATSCEEEGNAVHRGTVRRLSEAGVPVEFHRATVLVKSDYDKYDYFLGMEQRNLRAMRNILGGDKDNKIYALLDFSLNPRDIADPWWTGNFDATYADVREGCDAFLNFLIKKYDL